MFVCLTLPWIFAVGRSVGKNFLFFIFVVKIKDANKNFRVGMILDGSVGLRQTYLKAWPDCISHVLHCLPLTRMTNHAISMM
jgi:hypothetical protein